MKEFGLLTLMVLFTIFYLNCSMIKKVEKEDKSLAAKSFINIIPKPQSVELKEGSITINNETQICLKQGDVELQAIAEYLKEELNRLTGLNLSINYSEKNIQKENTFFLRTGKEYQQLGEEGYSLNIENNKIKLNACKTAGLFYGVQTIRQLFASEISENSISLPCLKIEDSPRYQWRGMMLDVSRHFFPKEFILKFIDHLAMHKLNTFHWHLVDDQGWRIEIKKYPKLTEIGSWRVDREEFHWNSRESQKDGESASYGGFYTQEDIKEIVEYAKSRYITIIPEIEMPGHTVSALAAYPELSCTGGPFTVLPGGYWPVTDIYCAGNDSAFEFIENVLSEVIDLFPGKYIHIGGDEANKSNWEKCPKCQARIQSENLKDEHELQSYFIKRIERFLNSKNRQLIGWDEILEGGLAPGATVMSWRGMKGGVKAAQSGHDVVMSPTSHCYFDYYQGPQDSEPLAIGGYLPLNKVYSFEPTPDSLDQKEAKHILGAQANLWTEYVPTPEHAEYMTLPRISALAEVVWTQKELKNWDDFRARMEKQLNLYHSLGINYAKSAYAISAKSEFNLKANELEITLQTELLQNNIHYTLDGSTPTMYSNKYNEPITLNSTSILKAGVFKNGDLASSMIEKKFYIHKATSKKVTLKYSPDEKYQGGGILYGLTNSMRGSKNFGDGFWQGFHQDDLEAVIDLEKVMKIERIISSYLHNAGSWIFLPNFVEYATSDDGINFKTIATIINDVSLKYPDILIKDFEYELNNVEARYIRVKAKNVGICPEWHSGAGDKAWLFIDEIIVE